MLTRCRPVDALRVPRGVAVRLPGRPVPSLKTASGGPRPVPRRRVGSTGWQAADAPGENRQGRPWSRRGAVLPQNDDIVVTAYNRNDPRYHRYEFTNFICSSAQYGCSPERVFEGLLLNAAPGQNGPAFTGNIVSVPLAGRIQQVVNRGAMSVTNFTLPGHMFDPGYVTRSVISFGNSLYINTIGEGVGGNRGFNMLTAQPAFTFLDQRIKLYTVGGF